MPNQTKHFIITKLKEKCYPTFIAVIIVNVTYLLTALTQHTILSTFLAFPAIYITPGLMLVLLVSRHQNQNFRKLIVTSFFLSTIIAVMVTSTLVLFNITISQHSFSIVYTSLTLILVTLAIKSNKSPRINASRLEYALIGFSLVAYACLLYLFTSLPRLFTMDETTYITWARYTILKGETYPIEVSPTRSDLTYLIEGRFFWTLLISSFLGSTGLMAYQAHIISTMFLPMIAIASTLLIPNKLQNNNFLQLSTFLLILTNPLLLLFSDFILNDLALAFYLLVAVLFFIGSFNQSDEGSVSISLNSLALSLLTLLITFLIKENVVIMLGIYLILIFHIFRYRLYKISKIWRALLYALTLPLIAYEVFIDIPYVISVWFIKNETIAMLTSRFLPISPTEWLLGLFIPTPWKPTTIFSYDLYGYLNYLYRMLSPETLGLLAAGIGITLPLVLTLEGIHKDVQTRTLVYLSTITLWLTYFLYISANAFWEIPRYSLFMVPIIIVFSLAALYQIFSSRNITVGIALILPMLLLLWTQSTLSIGKGGVYVSYGLPKLNWTGLVILVQLLIYVVLVVATSSLYMKPLNTKTKWRKKAILNSRMYFTTLTVTVLLSNIYFSAYSLSNSEYFKEHNLIGIKTLLENEWQSDGFVISNTYFYARPYVPDDLLLRHYMFCPPMTKDEFIQLLEMLPNNTLILLSDDRDIAWHEYADKDGYIFQYTKSSNILKLKSERQVYSNAVLDLRFDSIYDNETRDSSVNQNSATLHGNLTLTQGVYGNALSFDGFDDYVEISHSDLLNPTASITIEAYVKPAVTPDGYRVILSKGWNYAGAWTLQVTPDAKWQWAIKNQTGTVFILEGGKVIAGEWTHLVGVWDGTQLWLYVNGVRYGPVNTTGYIGNSYEILVGVCELFGARNYWNGIIDEVRLYDRVLSEDEILGMYYSLKLSAECGGFKLFRVESTKTLNLNNQNGDVNIKSVSVWRSNSTNVRLEVKAYSSENESLLMFLDTYRFLKILRLNLVSGENTITFDFPWKLSSGDRYGIYIANWANIFIMDSKDNLLYHKLHTLFTLNSSNILLWLLFLLVLLFSILAAIKPRG